jgi:hypothetical protein
VKCICRHADSSWYQDQVKSSLITDKTFQREKKMLSSFVSAAPQQKPNQARKERNFPSAAKLCEKDKNQSIHITPNQAPTSPSKNSR